MEKTDCLRLVGFGWFMSGVVGKECNCGGAYIRSLCCKRENTTGPTNCLKLKPPTRAGLPSVDPKEEEEGPVELGEMEDPHSLLHDLFVVSFCPWQCYVRITHTQTGDNPQHISYTHIPSFSPFLSSTQPITSSDNSLTRTHPIYTHTHRVSHQPLLYIKQEDTRTHNPLASLAAGSLSSSSLHPPICFRRSHHRLPLPLPRPEEEKRE